MKEELETKLKELQSIRKELETKLYDEDIDDLDKEYTYYEIDRIIDEIFDVKRKLYFLNTPSKEGKEIDIREYGSGEVVKNYIICLHNTTEIIGSISYRGYHIKKSLGDIGYEIKEEYRGKGYAYKALCLLGEMLKEKGIDDFWITTENKNLASISTIEKYGGICIGNEGNTLFYSCQTRKLENKNNKNDSKKVI